MIDLLKWKSIPMPSPSAKEKADGNAWEVRRAARRSMGTDSEARSGARLSGGGWYIIEYVSEREDAAQLVASPMHFRDRDTALENACALLSAGFDVLKVVGPDFEMGGMLLVAYLRSRRSR